jgi:hypothetical protein
VTVISPLTAVTVLGAFVCVVAAPAATMPSSDEFDGAALTGWNVLRGDDQGDGVDHAISVVDGALVLQPRVSWWVDDHEALYLWKPVAGDFVATTRVQVTGTKSEQPDSDWTLSGILVRNPSSTHERENWVSLRTGFVDGDWSTSARPPSGRTRCSSSPPRRRAGSTCGSPASARASSSSAETRPAGGRSSGPTRGPTCRRRSRSASTRSPGFEAPRGDLVSHVDWFHFAPTGVPGRLRSGAAKKLLPYLTR